jgi:hypothetical protein
VNEWGISRHLRWRMLSASSLSDFQRELRCVAERMDARRGAQPMALPLASVATQQTPFRRATRRAGRAFGALRSKKVNEFHSISMNIHHRVAPKALPVHSR